MSCIPPPRRPVQTSRLWMERLLFQRLEAQLTAAAEAIGRSDPGAFLEVSKLDAIASAIAFAVGSESAWEWLSWIFPSDSDNGQIGPSAVQPGSVRHPGLAAARSGSSLQLRLLLERGLPLTCSLDNGFSPDVAYLAAKSRSSGSWALLEPAVLNLAKTSPDEAIQHLLAWLSGCAASAWGDGPLECEGAFRGILGDLPVPFYQKAVFLSPLEELLFDSDEVQGGDPAAALGSFLSLAPRSRWPIQEEPDYFSPQYEPVPQNRHSHFSLALHGASWWALEPLFDPSVDAPRLLSDLAYAKQQLEWSQRPEAARLSEQAALRLLASFEGGLIGSACDPSPLKPRSAPLPL